MSFSSIQMDANFIYNSNEFINLTLGPKYCFDQRVMDEVFLCLFAIDSGDSDHTTMISVRSPTETAQIVHPVH